VALQVEPFESVTGTRGWILGGTESRNKGQYVEVEPLVLVDDGQWHETTVDVRKLKTAAPELKYLRRFMFLCYWKEDKGQEFWFDDFSIGPE
jgi:hypothetical protein